MVLLPKVEVSMLGVVEMGWNWPKLMAGDCGRLLQRGSSDPELHTSPAENRVKPRNSRRIRIYTEENAKVVAASWGDRIASITCRAVAILTRTS